MRAVLSSILQITAPVQVAALALLLGWLGMRWVLRSTRVGDLSDEHRFRLAGRYLNGFVALCFIALLLYGLIQTLPLFVPAPKVIAAAGPTITPQESPAPVPAPIDAAVLKQATYVVDGERISLNDGEMTLDPPSEIPNNALHFNHVQLVDSAFGDLTGNGAVSAVALLEQTDGGSGIFYYLAPVTRQAGRVVSDTEAINLGDRLQFTQFEIRHGRVFITVLSHRTDDPLGRPSLVRHLEFAFAHGALTCQTHPCSEFEASNDPEVHAQPDAVFDGQTLAPRPSFDCANARESDDRAICSSADLSRLDGALGRAYRHALTVSAPTARQDLIAAQRAWLVERRERCGGNVGCLRDYLQMRSDQLAAIF